MTSDYYPAETYGMNFINQFPRFGHGSDFSQLASSDREAQTDYVVGILSVSFFILSLFIFWGAIILACKCMGKRRVGLFSGRVQVESDEKGQYRVPTYLWKLRCTFILFGTCMLLLCKALVGPGLSSISYTVDSVRYLNRDVNDLATQGLLIVDSVKRVKWNIDELDVDSILQIDGACPNFKNNTFTSNMERLDKEFDQLRQFVQNSDIGGIKQHVDVVLNGTDSVDQAVTTVEENDWIVKLFALFLGGSTIFMILAASITLTGRCQCLRALKCMSELIILPMFVVGIVGSWFAVSALAFANIPIADFCSGSSQREGAAGTVLDIFKERGIASDSLIYIAFMYYQSDCTTDDPIQYLYQYEDTLQRGIYSASMLIAKIDGIGTQTFIDQCGADVSSHIEGIGVIKDNLGILLDALRSTFELASCYNISPIYSQAFDGTICTDSLRSFTLMFLIMFTISLVGMVMILTRSAMYPFKVVISSSTVYGDEDEWEEYQAYLQYMASFINMWGGNTEDEFSVCSKSSVLKDSLQTSITHAFGDSSTVSSNPAVKDQTSPRNRRDPTPFYKSRELDVTFADDENIELGFEDEEKQPLSPIESKERANRSERFTRGTEQDVNDHIDDECTPLTPPSISSMQSSNEMRNRRLTPNFLQRWRRQEDSLGRNNDEMYGNTAELLPETPLMISPTAPQGRNYLARFISPLRKGNPDGVKIV